MPADATEPRARHDRRTPKILALALLVIGAVAAIAVYRERHGPTPRPPYSTVQFLAVCHDAHPGPLGVDMQGVVSELTPQSFPAKVRLAAVLSLMPDRPGRKFTLECSTADRRVSIERELRPEYRSDRATIVIVSLGEIELVKPGELRFHILCDGVPMVWRVVPVHGGE